MRKNLTRSRALRVPLLAWLMVLAAIPGKASLSGSYTINPSASASSTNYKTFASAVSDLVSGSRSDGGTANGSGVSGAVVFKVTNGSYNEQIAFSAISGASASNTITFESSSGDSSKVNLYYASSSSSTNNYTIYLSGADYIIFRKMTISRTGSNTYGHVVLMDGGASNNKFIGCHLKGKYMASTASLGFTASDACCFHSTGADTGNLFQGNRVTYGYNGFFITGSGTGNTIKNNIIDSSGSSAMYILSQGDHLLIEGNTINLGAFPSTSGHYVSYGLRLESSSYFRVVKNKFYSLSNASVSRCVVLFNCSSSSTLPGIIANNWAWVNSGTTSSTGIALGGNSYLDIYYNNVVMSANVSGSTALYVYPPTQSAGTANNIVNNNLAHKAGGYAIHISGNTSGMGTINYNNLYTTGTNLGNWNGTDTKDLSTWKTTSGKDANSISGDPGFVSNSDQHVSSSFLNNKGTTYSLIKDDLDGDVRSSSTPDIGADEFTPASLDAGVTRLDSPSFYCAGKRAIYLRITNYGTSSLTSVQVNWSVNGTAQTPYSWSGTLSTGSTSSSFKIGDYTFSANTRYDVKLWTSAPNTGTDGNLKNDTLALVSNTGMSGNFTIGGSNPDFKSFNEAIVALTSRGVCGPTTFKVRDGVYTEQLSFPQFVGVSSTNTVAFESESKDSTKVKISQASTTANGVNNNTIQFNGADYIILRRMTIERTANYTYASVIEMKGGSDGNIIENCRLIGIKLGSTNANGDVIYSLANGDNNNIIRNNLIRNGNYGINFLGDTLLHDNGNRFEGNTIDSSFLGYVNIGYSDDITFSDNKCLNMTTASNTGVRISAGRGKMIVQRNRLETGLGSAAVLDIRYWVGTSSAKGLVINNFVIAPSTSGNGAPRGITIVGCQYLDVAFNSVNVYNTNSGLALGVFGGVSNVNVVNNVLANSGGSYALYASGITGTFDYNNLYSTGTLARIAAKDYTILDSLKKTGSFGKSITAVPMFKSFTDLHTQNLLLSGAGVPVSGASTDFDRQNRDSKRPDIGADEMYVPKAEAGITDLASPPTGRFCEGTYDVVVKLRNFGTSPLTAAKIDWKVNGAAQTSYTFSGNMAHDSVASIKIGTYSFKMGLPQIDVWVSSPNGVKDSFPYNDTINVELKVDANPKAVTGSAQTVCAGSTVNLGSGNVGGNTYSWTSNPAGFTSNKSSISPVVKTTTWFILEETALAGCKKKDSVKITVQPAPAAATGTPSTICEGFSANIGATAVTGSTYKWTSSPAGFTSTSSSATVKPVVTTIYIMEETITATGCKKTDSVTVTVNPAPKANVGTPKAMCAGETRRIGAPAPGSPNAFDWTSKPAGFYSGNPYPDVSPTVSTTYYLTETDATTGCSRTDSVRVTVYPVPVAKITGSNAACSQVPFVYSATGNSGDSYSWAVSGSGGTIVSGNGTDEITVLWTTSGVGNVLLQQSNPGGCQDVKNMQVIVTEGAKAKFGAQTVCVGQTTVFKDSSSGASSYVWEFGDGQTSIVAQPTHAYAAAGTYRVKLTAIANSGCTDTTIRMVKVEDRAKSRFTTTPTVCAGITSTFNNTSTNAASYLWKFGDGQTSTSATPVHKFGAPGTYTVKLVAFSAGGCADSSTSNVVVEASPRVSFTLKQNSPLVYSFKAKDSTKQTYTWDFGDGGTGNGPNATHTFAAKGQYAVKLTVKSAAGCEGTFDTTVTIKDVGISDPMADAMKLEVYPNPFRSELMVSYDLPAQARISISLYDMAGKEIAQVYTGSQSAGGHSQAITGTDKLGAGLYMLRIQMDDAVTYRRVVKVD